MTVATTPTALDCVLEFGQTSAFLTYFIIIYFILGLGFVDSLGG